MAKANIQEGYKDQNWFDSHPLHVLKIGQRANLLQTGKSKLGDGVTQLQYLEWLGITPEDHVLSVNAKTGIVVLDPTDIGADPAGAAAAAETASKDYADTQDAANLQAAKDYADTGDANTLSDSKTYTDQQDADVLQDAKDYADTGDATTLNASKAYTDSQTTSVYRPVGGWDASGGTYPIVGSGTAGAVRRGDTYNVTVAGTIYGEDYDIGDNFYANVNTPGQTPGNWSRFESNTQQATEGARGTAMVATQAEIEDQTSTNDQKFVTVKKFWLGLSKFLGLYKDKSGGLAGLTLFKINFRNAADTFTSFLRNLNTAGRTYTFQDRDGTIADDTDLAGKQASLGFTPENSANKDASGGYAGLTLFKINFKNVANTFISFFTNSNTAARTYTFQNRDGTIADDTDLALKANLASPVLTGTPSLPVGTTGVSPLIAKGVGVGAVTGTTNETLLYSVLIPANTFAAGDILRFFLRLFKTGTAGTWAIKVYVNSSASLSGAVQIAQGSNVGGVSAITLMLNYCVLGAFTTSGLFERVNLVSPFSMQDDISTSTNASATFAWDTTAAKYLIVSTQNTSAADSVRIGLFTIQKS